MKKMIILLIILNLLGCGEENKDVIIPDKNPQEEFSSDKYYEWGIDAIEQITRDFQIPSSYSYYENQDKNHSTYLWGNIFMLYAQVEATSINQGLHETDLTNIYNSCEAHWHPNYQGIAGYSTSPTSEGNFPDRFYDENGWMAIGLCDAYSATNNEKYLAKAKAAINFTFAGEDEILDGGIYFKETFINFEEQKNAVCCAVAILGSLKIYELTKEQKYLDDAIRINNWVTERLLDPTDNLFWDAQYTSDGRINKTKWSYNAGFMIRAWLLLYEFTNDNKYLTQAKSTLASSEVKWYNSTTGAMSDPGYFAFTLIDCWFDLYDLEQDDSYLTKAFRAVEFVHDHLQDANGRYPEYWSSYVTETMTEWSLFHQAVIPYIYLRASRYSD